MCTHSSHMNGGSYWEGGLNIYDTPGVPNNFPECELSNPLKKKKKSSSK